MAKFVKSEGGVTLELPKMALIYQEFEAPKRVNISAELDREWADIKPLLHLTPGKNIAVAVGSRGISNLSEIVRIIVSKLKAAGAYPFIVPAMGSHGGATAEGQTKVLKTLGITEDNVGVPVRATMEVKQLGKVDGIPLFVDRFAYEADGIVLINRIKPHTNFIGPTESGLIKMMAIGLGKKIGAEHYHRLSLVRDQYSVISSAGRELIKRHNVLFGVGIIENHHHEVCLLKIIPPNDIEQVEIDLLKKARAYLPKLPLNKIDLLIIDEMGKDISGEGIDPNVVGRDVCMYGARRPSPKITRIFVRDLTEATQGNALGIGQADFTTRRLVDKINLSITAENCLVSCCPEAGKIPLAYENDLGAIKASLKAIRPYTPEDIKIVHIKNTRDLAKVAVSHGCLSELEGKSGIKIVERDLHWEFDSSGNLFSPLTS